MRRSDFSYEVVSVEVLAWINNHDTCRLPARRLLCFKSGGETLRNNKEVFLAESEELFFQRNLIERQKRCLDRLYFISFGIRYCHSLSATRGEMNRKNFIGKGISNIRAKRHLAVLIRGQPNMRAVCPNKSLRIQGGQQIGKLFRCPLITNLRVSSLAVFNFPAEFE